MDLRASDLKRDLGVNLSKTENMAVLWNYAKKKQDLFYKKDKKPSRHSSPTIGRH